MIFVLIIGKIEELYQKISIILNRNLDESYNRSPLEGILMFST
jgi:hypothetical protein